MSRNPKLNDLQLVLLSTAADRKDGSIFPPADSIAKEQDRIRKAIPPLLRRGLVAEVPVKIRTQAWREEDEQRIGLRLSDAGRALIAPEVGEGDAAAAAASVTPAAGEKASSAPRQGSKAELVLGLLRRLKGATLAELVDTTGWLPHTTRAALTGLRKKGHSVEKTKRGDATCYRVVEAG